MTGAGPEPVGLEGRHRKSPTHDYNAPEIILVATLLALGFALRIWHGQTSFWVDEIASAQLYFDTSPTHWISRPYYPANHPLFSIAAWGSWKLFGATELAARIPSLLAGVGVVAIGWLTARRLWDTRVAWVFAALMALAHTQIRYSSEARGYELATFFMVVTLFFVVRGLQDRSFQLAILSAVPAVLAAFTHLSSLMFLLVPAVYWIATSTRADGSGKRVRLLLMLLGWGTVIAVAVWGVYRPMIDLGDAVLTLVGGGETPVSRGSLPLTARRAFDWRYVRGLGALLGNGSRSWWALSFCAFAWGAGVASSRSDRSVSALHLGPLAVILLSGALGLVFFARFFVVLQPVVLMTMAVGSTAIASRIVRSNWVLPATLLTAAVLMAPPLLQSPGLPVPDRPWREAANFIAERSDSGQVLAYPLAGERYSVIRRAAGYYLRPYGIEVVNFNGDVPPGTTTFYVTLSSYPEDRNWDPEVGDPHKFGNILLYYVTWTVTGFVEQSSLAEEGDPTSTSRTTAGLSRPPEGGAAPRGGQAQIGLRSSGVEHPADPGS